MAHFKNRLGHLLFGTVLACLCASPTWPSEEVQVTGGELAAYLARPDPEFGWREVKSGSVGGIEYAEYLLTSQTWRGIREDGLIAYTFDQYLQTGEADWPILLPMVKSATRAMDAVQDIARQRWNISIESFTVTGASKRGWTAWLTAAMDDRVMAVAPMVIDVLNMRAQMEHQRATWGEFSEQIRDYSELDLQRRLQSERGNSLLTMVDPFSYRERLTQPKLILLSTNDRYWPLDALNIYWQGLPDPKNVLYVPNQGHGLRDADRVIDSLSALHRYAASSRPLPRTTSSVELKDRAVTLAVESDRPAKRVLLWSARSPTLDFREARWSSHKCARAGKGHSCSQRRPDQGYTAVFAETFFRDADNPAFSTTTTVCILGPETSGCGS